MNVEERRKKIFQKMKTDSILVLFSGIPVHVGSDQYAKFEANRNFFYLTDIRREKMILVMSNLAGKEETALYIEEADPLTIRWRGKRMLKGEAEEISGISDIRYLDDFLSGIDRKMMNGCVEHMYFDCYREQYHDLPGYNLTRAKEFQDKYPAVKLCDVHPLIAEERMIKEPEEIDRMKEAISITNDGLCNVLANLTPGVREYQVQADFEYIVHYNGGDGMAFPTIAGSGANGTMLHYETNQEICEDGSLILLDLGAKYEGYCADITRTYPVNGTYSKRQRQVYDIVLRANREIVKAARPGMTRDKLNDICKDVLAEGCIELGLIQNKEEISKYYMHGVSHHIGIDVHDVTVPWQKRLESGCVISDEPGLYIDEWEIGIRIEDDLLITENGCICLSEDIMRDPDEIEAYMKKRKMAGA